MTDWDAADYAGQSEAQLAWAMELMEKLEWAGDERVLDLGCGDGKVTAELAKRVPKGSVVGLDNSQEMIEYATGEWGEVANVEFELGDVLELGYADEFDVVFSNACLHWVRDHGVVLKGISAALKVGGRAILQMGGRGNARGVLEVIEQVRRREKWAGSFEGFGFRYGFYGPMDYGRWLIGSGLRGTRMELIEKEMAQTPETPQTPQTPELRTGGFAGWLRTTWHPYVNCVAEGDREDFIDEVVGTYVEKFGLDDDGKVSVGMVRFEVEMVKEG